MVPAAFPPLSGRSKCRGSVRPLVPSCQYSSHFLRGSLCALRPWRARRLVHLDPFFDISDPTCIRRHTQPPFPFMNEDESPGAVIFPVPRPVAMTASAHRHSRTRSQITALSDIDLANALSVAPAPHSWRDAEERVLSGFGDNFPTPASADVQSLPPHKEYFGDLECVSERFDNSDRSIYS